MLYNHCCFYPSKIICCVVNFMWDLNWFYVESIQFIIFLLSCWIDFDKIICMWECFCMLLFHYTIIVYYCILPPRVADKGHFCDIRIMLLTRIWMQIQNPKNKRQTRSLRVKVTMLVNLGKYLVGNNVLVIAKILKIIVFLIVM